MCAELAPAISPGACMLWGPRREYDVARRRGRLYLEFVGRTFHFECPRCLYRARVSGNADSGLYCEIQTIVCLDCRQLYDVFTRLRQRGAPEETRVSSRSSGMHSLGLVIPPLIVVDNPLREFKPGHRTMDAPSMWRWTKVKPCCPRDAQHRIETWKHPGHCPRCGTFMKKTGFPYRLWD